VFIHNSSRANGITILLKKSTRHGAASGFAANRTNPYIQKKLVLSNDYNRSARPMALGPAVVI
jgi:hypothetical protein